MILATHLLIYSHDPEATRAFLRDVLQLPHVDTGGGWLIFRTGPSELAAHPASWEHEGEKGGTDQQYDISLACDDLQATVDDLTSRGAELDGGFDEQPWGTTTQLKVPGMTGTMMLYQPKYALPALG